MPRKLFSWLGATILGVAGLALVPSTAFAACQQWDVSGRWSLQQDNDYVVEMNIQQDGNRLSGEAAFHRTTDGTPAPDNFTGKLDEDYFTFTVRWNFPGHPVGVYKGNIDSQGRMQGRTYDKAHPGDEGSAAFWRGNRTATCLDQPEAPAPRPEDQVVEAVPDQGGSSAADVISGAGVWLPDLAVTGVSGPGSLQAGLSGTFTVQIANPGNSPARVEINILFTGKLDQTGQIVAGAGLACSVEAGGSAKINAMLVCNGGQLGAGESTTITVQGRGQATGKGAVVATLNNSRSVEESSYDNNLGRLDLNIN